jgi:hypothetical protein
MKTLVRYSAFVLAIAMAAMINTGELNAQVRSSAGRSGQSRAQQVTPRNQQATPRAQQVTPKDQMKMDKKQDKVDRQQMPANINRQPELNHQVDMARKNNQLMVPFRPDRHGRVWHAPVMAPVPVFTPAQVRIRTNATRLVVYTDFFTKAQAYAYVSNLLADMYYDIDTYDTSYGWFNTSMTVIPTPHGWADPRAANQFRIRFDFKRSGGRIKVYITGQWRESMLGGPLYDLRYQPSDRYSTFYAWNILEQIATAIPNYRVEFQ